MKTLIATTLIVASGALEVEMPSNGPWPTYSSQSECDAAFNTPMQTLYHYEFNPDACACMFVLD